MDFWNIDKIADRLEQLDIAIDREAMSLGRWIWEDAMGFDKSQSKPLDPDESKKLSVIIQRLVAGEPIQYIVEHAWFYGIKFFVNPDVLIPRPETEELVEWILSDTKSNSDRKLRILDIGTGSGCIAVVLKNKLGTKAEVVAIDTSEKALKVASRNSQALHADVQFMKRDFLKSGFSKLGTFDVIVSNPPYVSKENADKDILQKLKYEPPVALYPEGGDPDIFYKKISREAPPSLQPGGRCYVELNEFRAQNIENIFRGNHWTGVETRIDLQGLPRMLRATVTGQ